MKSSLGQSGTPPTFDQLVKPTWALERGGAIERRSSGCWRGWTPGSLLLERNNKQNGSGHQNAPWCNQSHHGIINQMWCHTGSGACLRFVRRSSENDWIKMILKKAKMQRTLRVMALRSACTTMDTQGSSWNPSGTTCLAVPRCITRLKGGVQAWPRGSSFSLHLWATPSLPRHESSDPSVTRTRDVWDICGSSTSVSENIVNLSNRKVRIKRGHFHPNADALQDWRTIVVRNINLSKSPNPPTPNY